MQCVSAFAAIFFSLSMFCSALLAKEESSPSEVHTSLPELGTPSSYFQSAQAHFVKKEYEKALFHYQKRVEFGDNGNEEVFWAYLQIARLHELLQKAPCEIIESYSKAYFYLPTRAEPLFFLATFYRLNMRFLEGYQVAMKGLFLPLPSSAHYVEPAVYDFELLLEFASCAQALGRYMEAKLALELLQKKEAVPTDVRIHVEQSLRWCNTKLLGGVG